jgi:hypothetical protein
LHLSQYIIILAQPEKNLLCKYTDDKGSRLQFQEFGRR